MDQPSTRRRSVFLIVVIAAVLSLLSWLFYEKVTAMLKGENEISLLNLAETQARSFERSLDQELAFLSGVATLAGLDRDRINWWHVQQALEHASKSRFSVTGAVDVDGRGIVGPDVALPDFPGIQRAFRGYTSINVLPSGTGLGEAGFMAAVPVVDTDGMVRYAMYGLLSKAVMSAMLAEATAEAAGEASLFDASNQPLLHNPDSSLQALFDQWRKDPAKYGVEEDFCNLNNKVKRYKKGIEHFRALDGEELYIEAVPLSINGWSFIGIIPGADMKARVGVVGRLFLLVFGSLLILFVIVLVYSQVADADYREQLYILAYVDGLTGLPNWQQVRRDLNRIMKTEKRPKPRALVTFDVKGFKVLNEMFGYRSGDTTLRHIGKQMQTVFAGRKDVLYCRFENDTFAYVVPSEDAEKTEAELKATLAALSQDPNFSKQRLRFSCGIVTIPAGGGDRNWNSYMNASRIARQYAKKKADTTITYFDDELRNQMIQAQRLRGDMEEALVQDDFLMYLQPKYAIALKGNERIAGAEALVRWNHRDMGMLHPGVFIPIFEEDGSIDKIDRYIFKKACRNISRWLKEKRKIFPISVNLSRVQLSNPNLIDELTDIADMYGTPRKYIEIELTESASFGDMDRLLQIMRDLKACGFKLSLDDFGTGYSSLSLLRDMPMDVLKLDKSFIDPLGKGSTDRKTLQFIRDIISMADNLGIQTVAEGVETERQLDILREVNCDIVQGYYFSKPVPVREYEEMLARAPQTRKYRPGTTVFGS